MARRRPTEPTPSVARGAALVVVAVLAGVFLLRNGVDTSVTLTTERSPGQVTTPDDATDDGDATDEGDPEATTTTEPEARPPTQVITLVLNGSGVSGAAGTYTTALSDAGYQTRPAGNAPERVEVTQVLYAEGYEQEAQVVATTIGAPAAVVAQPLPDPPPEGAEDANVVVILGPDLGSVTPPPADGAADAGGTADVDVDADADGTEGTDE
jgi:hypothetical protein